MVISNLVNWLITIANMPMVILGDGIVINCHTFMMFMATLLAIGIVLKKFIGESIG